MNPFQDADKVKECLRTKTCMKCGAHAQWIPVFLLTGPTKSCILFQGGPFCQTCMVQQDFEDNCERLRKEFFLTYRRELPQTTMRNFPVTMVRLV